VPRLVPFLVAFWAFLQFFVGFLGPSMRQVAVPHSGEWLLVVFLFAFAAAVAVLVGTTRLRPLPVRLTIAILAGYPAVLIIKALVTGYFSAWVAKFLAILIVTNGIALWYLFRPSVRNFWVSRVRPAPSAAPAQ